MIIVGIDPGKKGYCVLIDTSSTTMEKAPIEFDKAGMLDEAKLVSFLDSRQVNMILIEKVGGRVGWGASQVFNFGFGYGQIRQVVARYPHTLVPAQTWQKVIHAGISPKLPAKERSLLAYKQLYPNGPIQLEGKQSKLNDNLIDALLIATYGVLKFDRCCIRPWQFSKKIETCKQVSRKEKE